MTDTIKRRKDGSIDSSHYMAQARRMRAESAKHMVRPATPRPAARAQPGVGLWLLAAAVILGAALPFAA